MTTSPPPVWFLVLTITSVAMAMKIEQALLPILRQCDIHILSHRCATNDTFTPFAINPIDQALENHVVKQIISRNLPYKFTTLPCNTPWEDLYFYLEKNSPRSKCETFIWALEPYSTGWRNLIDFRFTWLSYTVNSARDFTIILFGQVPTPINIYNMNTETAGETENILIGMVRRDTADVVSIGGVRRSCDDTGRTCLDLHAPKSSTIALDSPDFFRQFAPRSIYSTSFKYNLHKMTFFVSLTDRETFNKMAEWARDVGLRGIMVGPDDYNRTEKLRLFLESTDSGSYAYYKVVGVVELFEHLFNVTVKHFEAKTLEPAFYPSVHLGVDMVSYPYPQSVAESFQYDLVCVNKASNQIDVSSFLNPLDKWIWLCFVTFYVLLGLFLRSRSPSPFFMLLAPVLEQDSGISVKRFSFLILIWSFTCFLLSNLFSGMIGSFLVVPPATPSVQDFKQAYEEGYKMFFGIDRFESSYRHLHSDIAIGDYENTTALRQKYEYLIKLEEEMEIVDGNNTATETFDRQIHHGKGCIGMRVMEYPFSSIVDQAYPGYVGFSVKQKLLQLVDSWTFAGPYQSPAYRAFSAFLSTGVNNIYTSWRIHDSRTFKQKIFGKLMRRKDPHHIETRFFSVGRVEIPYLLLLKYEQTKLVFYMWMGLSGLASLVFLFRKVTIGQIKGVILKLVRYEFWRSLSMRGLTDHLQHHKERLIGQLRSSLGRLHAPRRVDWASVRTLNLLVVLRAIRNPESG